MNEVAVLNRRFDGEINGFILQSQRIFVGVCDPECFDLIVGSCLVDLSFNALQHKLQTRQVNQQYSLTLVYHHDVPQTNRISDVLVNF